MNTNNNGGTGGSANGKPVVWILLLFLVSAAVALLLTGIYLYTVSYALTTFFGMRPQDYREIIMQAKLGSVIIQFLLVAPFTWLYWRVARFLFYRTIKKIVDFAVASLDAYFSELKAMQKAGTPKKDSWLNRLLKLIYDYLRKKQLRNFPAPAPGDA